MLLGANKPRVPAHEHRAPFRLHSAMGAGLVNLPSETMNRASGAVPPVKIQKTSSCEAHRTVTNLVTRYNTLGQPLDIDPSEKDLYAKFRAVERARSTPADQELPDLQDQGSYTDDAFVALGKWGFVSKDPATTQDNSDDDPNTVNDDPKLLGLEDGAKRIITGEYAIDPTAADAELQIRTALSKGIPLGVDFWVDSPFMAWTNGMAPLNTPPNENDPNGGGHAIALVDFVTLDRDMSLPDGTTLHKGTIVYVLRNSWGTAYGSFGDWLVTGRWLRKTWEHSVWDIRAAS